MATPKKAPKMAWLTIKTGSGQITGYIEGFWCAAAKRYVTIPDVSRFRAA